MTQAVRRPETPPDLAEVTSDGRLRLHFHEGQQRAWDSTARFIAVLAGTQSGKTSFGPFWLFNEITLCGAGDYIVVAPTFQLLQKKLLPEFIRLFGRQMRLGEYKGSPIKHFTFTPEAEKRVFGEEQDVPTNVYFGHAHDPDSLESATAKAAWLDEAGQKKFKFDSWEAILRRLSLAQGRVLLTTTIYNLGWLKQKLYDPWKAGDPDIEVVRFESIANPTFPREEYERAKRSMPQWKFDMMYRALFTRPAGLIYDSFDEERHKMPRFAIPDEWKRYLGLDFGGVNTVGLFYAEEPYSKQLYLYREYKAGGRTARGHVDALLAGEPMRPTAVGGAKSEQQWRDEFAAAGLAVREPKITEVEVGIDRVYGAHKDDAVMVFDDLPGYLEQKLTYSRELDDAGEPTEAIEDKHSFHFCDAERYVISYLRGGRPTMAAPTGVGQAGYFSTFGQM